MGRSAAEYALVQTAEAGGRRAAPSGQQFAHRLLPFVLPFAIFLAWQIAATREWLPPQILPSPALVAQTTVELVRDGQIAENIAISLRRIAVGVGAGIGAGLALGTLLGLSRPLELYLGPLLRGIASVPSLGWLPVFMLIFGLDETLKYVIIAKACLVPVTLNTAEGIRNIPESYREVGRVLRLRRRSWLMKFAVPAALPAIFTGVRLAVSHGWIALIIVEMLAAAEGIGYMMSWGRTLFQLDIVIVGMVVIGAIGYAMDAGLKAVETRLRRWEPHHG